MEFSVQIQVRDGENAIKEVTALELTFSSLIAIEG
jgi:hypothetical protein